MGSGSGGGGGAGAGGGLLGAGASIMQGNQEAKANRAQGRFQRDQAFKNAAQAEKDAKRVAALGRKASRQNLKQTSQMIGNQRVALAAQGIVVDEGVADVIQRQTKEIGLEDALTIRNNAMREALGLKNEATQYRVQGQMDLAAAYRRAGAAKLKGTMGAISGLTSAAKSAASGGAG